jgi:hypothetical protein
MGAAEREEKILLPKSNKPATVISPRTRAGGQGYYLKYLAP